MNFSRAFNEVDEISEEGRLLKEDTKSLKRITLIAVPVAVNIFISYFKHI